jgi:hypothetical protein
MDYAPPYPPSIPYHNPLPSNYIKTHSVLSSSITQIHIPTHYFTKSMNSATQVTIQFPYIIFHPCSQQKLKHIPYLILYRGDGTMFAI